MTRRLPLGFGQTRAGMVGWARFEERKGERERLGRRSLQGLVLRDRTRGLSQRLLRCVRVETLLSYYRTVCGVTVLSLVTILAK